MEGTIVLPLRAAFQRTGAQTEHPDQLGVRPIVSALVALALLLQPPSISQKTVDHLAAYSRKNGGVSFVLLQDGKVVYEEYPNGGKADRTWELASGTKSFSGVAALCAQKEGLLDLDEPASKTLTEWQGDERKSITIRQILSLSSGIVGKNGPLAANRVPTYREAITHRPSAKPGTKFQYGAVPYMIWGEILRRKIAPLKLSVQEYYESRIFKPLGMSHGLWRKEADGNVHLPSGLSMTAREWAKFGEMIRLDGQGVLPAGAIKTLFRPSTANASYGLTWWMPTASGGLRRAARGPQDVGMAAGLGGQRLFVVPSLKLTIVRQAPVLSGEGSFRDIEFLRILDQSR